MEEVVKELKEKGSVWFRTVETNFEGNVIVFLKCWRLIELETPDITEEFESKLL